MRYEEPLISVCIPAYNRAVFLEELLESILSQACENIEIVICEDSSPERQKIKEIVKERFRGQENIVYIENDINYGYDGNIRKLIREASGKYCVFMGNDDVMCEGSLAEINRIVTRYPECGVVIRSYGTFEEDKSKIKQIFRYFPSEKLVQAGSEAISTAFRRSVVIPGMVIHRKAALELETDRYDGSLLYQLYLVGNILAERCVVFTPKVIALRRDGVAPDFGNSRSEIGKFTPKEQTVCSSLYFMKEMLRIARDLEYSTNNRVYDSILTDIGRYSYPILAVQESKGKRVLFRYAYGLAELGLWKCPMFYLYLTGLLIIGTRGMNGIVRIVKSRLGYTPFLGPVGR